MKTTVKKFSHNKWLSFFIFAGYITVFILNEPSIASKLVLINIDWYDML